MFWEQFPYYLSIGMTETQYWDGDCALTKYYRKADALKRKSINQQAWLQGLYVYDAILRASPVLNAFAKKGTKPRPYVEEAYPIDEVEVKEQTAHKEKANSQKGIAYMEAFMMRNNKKF